MKKTLTIYAKDLNDYTLEAIFEDLDEVVSKKVGKRVTSYGMELTIKIDSIETEDNTHNG